MRDRGERQVERQRAELEERYRNRWRGERQEERRRKRYRERDGRPKIQGV